MTSKQSSPAEGELERYHLAHCAKYESLRGIYPNDRRATGKPCSCGFEATIAAHTKRECQTAYTRGYNTAFQNSKRHTDLRRLTIAAEQLEEMAKTMRKAAKLATLHPTKEQTREDGDA